MTPTAREIELSRLFIEKLNDLTVRSHESLTIDDVLGALAASGAKITGIDDTTPMVLG